MNGTVWRKEIWNEMRKICFSKKLFKLCRILNNEIGVKFKVGKHLSSEFKFIKVLRQVDAIAPLLFNAVMEIAVGRSKVQTRGNLFDKCSQIMACADDVVIMGRRVKTVEKYL
jgi:hypothetical protein